MTQFSTTFMKRDCDPAKEPIPVEPFPISKTYNSPWAAVAGAHRHPLQKQALSDTERLAGSSLVDASWSESDFVMTFSNGRFLHVYLEGSELRWQVLGSKPCIEVPLTIGAPPKKLLWPRDVGVHEMDCSKLIESRIGHRFTRLFVNRMGLWVYLKSHLILVFGPILRTDTRQSWLHVSESE